MALRDEYCLGCMEPTRADPCPHCGKSRADVRRAHPQFLAPGTMLGNRYMIGRSLGNGGFGITYIALQVDLRMKLAVKEFFPRELVSRAKDHHTVRPLDQKMRRQYFDEGRRKVVDEARRLAQLAGSPHVVNVRSYEEFNGTAYIVMDFLPGPSLHQLRLNYPDGRIGEATVATLLEQILKGLRDIHNVGLIHRDVKPANMICTGRPISVKLIDLGAARGWMRDQVRSQTIQLARGYAAVEQYFRRGKFGPATDLYGAGATAYTLLTGKRPVESIEVANQRPASPPLHEIPGLQITRRFSDVIAKAMSLKAEDRFQSADEMLESLNYGGSTHVESVQSRSYAALKVSLAAGFESAIVTLNGQRLGAGDLGNELRLPTGQPAELRVSLHGFHPRVEVFHPTPGQTVERLNIALERYLGNIGQGQSVAPPTKSPLRTSDHLLWLLLGALLLLGLLAILAASLS